MKRKWYNQKMVESKVLEFEQLFKGIEEKELLETIKTCDYKTFRLICNALAECGYQETRNLFSNMEYEQQKRICIAVNNRVNEIFGRFAPLYDLLMKSQKHECYRGDERFKLFGYNLPPYADRQVLKSFVQLIAECVDKPLKVNDLEKINYLLNRGLYWTLVPEISSVRYPDWETNDESFNILNDYRKAECEAWYTFTKYVFEGKYALAYSIMQTNKTNA